MKKNIDQKSLLAHKEELTKRQANILKSFDKLEKEKALVNQEEKECKDTLKQLKKIKKVINKDIASSYKQLKAIENSIKGIDQLESADTKEKEKDNEEKR